MDTVM